MVIQNAEAIGINPARKMVLEITEAGLAALDTRRIIQKAIRFSDDTLFVREKIIPVNKKGKLLVIAIGKCSIEAAAALEKSLGIRITAGIALDVKKSEELKIIRSFQGDHPYPTEVNRDATAQILNLLSGLTAEDTVIFVISGGGTVLLCQPQVHTCEQEKEIVHGLFRSGATIVEMNMVRKHLSLARGGFLAKAAYPAQVVSLIFSDVIGNDISMIASGPTVKDMTTVRDALQIVREYDLQDNPSFDPAYFIETPKEDMYFEKVQNILLVSNMTALEAMADMAKQLGFSPTIVTNIVMGEARDVGKKIAQEIASAPPKSVYLYGGETTVTVRGRGKGGRNQELVLGAIRSVPPGVELVSVASDGVDNSEAAGALCDTLMRTIANEYRLDPERFLAENNSFSFFEKVGGHIVTGQTGANVADLIIGLKT